MQVVSDEENSDVISWLPHGKGFIIYKKKKFASDVLPKHFKQAVSEYTRACGTELLSILVLTPFMLCSYRNTLALHAS